MLFTGKSRGRNLDSPRPGRSFSGSRDEHIMALVWNLNIQCWTIAARTQNQEGLLLQFGSDVEFRLTCSRVDYAYADVAIPARLKARLWTYFFCANSLVDTFNSYVDNIHYQWKLWNTRQNRQHIGTCVIERVCAHKRNCLRLVTES